MSVAGPCVGQFLSGPWSPHLQSGAAKASPGAGGRSDKAAGPHGAPAVCSAQGSVIPWTPASLTRAWWPLGIPLSAGNHSVKPLPGSRGHPLALHPRVVLSACFSRTQEPTWLNSRGRGEPQLSTSRVNLQPPRRPALLLLGEGSPGAEPPRARPPPACACPVAGVGACPRLPSRGWSGRARAGAAGLARAAEQRLRGAVRRRNRSGRRGPCGASVGRRPRHSQARGPPPWVGGPSHMEARMRRRPRGRGGQAAVGRASGHLRAGGAALLPSRLPSGGRPGALGRGHIFQT